MARNVDIFQEKIKGQYIYQQYQKLEWLKKYALFIDKYLQETYFDKIKEMWDTMNVAESLHPYLTFYTKWYFGLYRPLSGASVNEYFDINLLYDNDVLFDDAINANGLIEGDDYLAYIKFIYDYSQPVWNIHYIMEFIASYCEIKPNELYLDYNDPNYIKIKIPYTAHKAQDFIKMVINNYDEMCLPFPNIIDINIMQEADDFWRGILYTLYGDNNHFPYLGVAEKVAKQYYADIVLYEDNSDPKKPKEYKVTEKRTYQCLKTDRSISAEKVEPQHLKDKAYWKLKQYNKGAYVYIPQDAKIMDSPTGNTPLYTAGLYKCIKDDLDIQFNGVFVYDKAPADYPKSTGTPLCFDRYVDVPKANGIVERIPAWKTKWEQVYTQQEVDIIFKHGLDDLDEFNGAYPIEFKF